MDINDEETTAVIRCLEALSDLLTTQHQSSTGTYSATDKKMILSTIQKIDRLTASLKERANA